MYCHKCGKEIENQSVFCIYCGNKIPIEEPDCIKENNAVLIPKLSELPNKECDDSESKEKVGMSPVMATIMTLLVDIAVLILAVTIITLIGFSGYFFKILICMSVIGVHKAVYNKLTCKNRRRHKSDNNKNENKLQENTVANKDCYTEEKKTINEENTKSIFNAVKLTSESKNDEVSSPIDDEMLVDKKDNIINPTNICDSKHNTNDFFIKSEREQIVDQKNNIDKRPTIANVINKYRLKVVVPILMLLSLLVCVFIITNKNDNTKVDHDYFKDVSTNINNSASYETDEERWDAENYIYANYKYGFALNLPVFLHWKKVSGTAKHTVVKFIQPSTNMCIFVNINPFDYNFKGKQSEDIWANFEEKKNFFVSNVIPEVNRNTSEEVIDYDFRKVTICGKHAIKICYVTETNDDRYKDSDKTICLDYSFIHNNSTVTISIKCRQEVVVLLEEEGLDLEDLLKSFELTPISEKYKYEKDKEEYGAFLKELALVINSSCPNKIDNFTTLRTAEFDGKNIVYEIDIDGFAYHDMDFDIKAYKKNVIENFKNTIQEIKDMPRYLEQYDFGFEYRFYVNAELKEVLAIKGKDFN